ncbi:unnamed protein product [Closterium sp. NIES-64]|nr:unnamed protein product [Closterium sp. NIES-64]CAI6000130.1 unnamed protein product [Closterium sp. NIES-64]
MLPITVWIHSLPVQSTCLISFHSTPALSCNPPLRTLHTPFPCSPSQCGSQSPPPNFHLSPSFASLPSFPCSVPLPFPLLLHLTSTSPPLLQNPPSPLPLLLSCKTPHLPSLSPSLATLPPAYAIAMLPITVWITVFLSRLNMAI